MTNKLIESTWRVTWWSQLEYQMKLVGVLQSYIQNDCDCVRVVVYWGVKLTKEYLQNVVSDGNSALVITTCLISILYSFDFTNFITHHGFISSWILSCISPYFYFKCHFKMFVQANVKLTRLLRADLKTFGLWFQKPSPNGCRTKSLNTCLVSRDKVVVCVF